MCVYIYIYYIKHRTNGPFQVSIFIDSGVNQYLHEHLFNFEELDDIWGRLGVSC